MAEESWLAQQSKKKNRIWIPIVAVLVVVAAALFIRNNRELLLPEESRKPAVSSVKSVSAPPVETVAVVEKKMPLKDTVSHVVPKRELRTDEKITAVVNKPEERKVAEKKDVKELPLKPSVAVLTLDTVRIQNIRCKIADASHPMIMLSVSLLFPTNPALRQEILVKRDNLSVLIQKMLSMKLIDDIKTETLRKEILVRLNPFLDSGAATDISLRVEIPIDKVK